jgi:hypothetical protein
LWNRLNKTKENQKMRKAVPNKTRALLQKEISSKCPFCNNGDVGCFEVHHMDKNPGNNNPENLLMVCPLCHAKITNGDISYDEVLTKKNKPGSNTGEDKVMGKIIYFKDKIDNAVIGDNNTVNIITKKNNKNKYPEGCIGFDNSKANYIGYLTSRYNEYKEYEVGKENMRYGLLLANLKRKYKIGQTRTIYNLNVEKFEELANEIKKRIDGTMLAKINKGKGQLKNYDDFEDYVIQ